MPRMRRRADIVAELRQVIADAPQPCLEALGLVLVVVDAEDVEVLPGEVDHLLAPHHVVRALLSARDDARPGRDLPQPAAIEVDDFGVRSAVKPLFIGSLSI